MSNKPRLFTVAEANALLPRLNILLEQQMELLSELDAGLEALRALGGDPDDLEPAPSDSPAVREAKAVLQRKAEAFRAGWTEVEATGAVVKDVRLGLLDFYGRLDGQLVWLCWRYGEPAVGHWHALDRGFASRSPLPRTSIPPTMN
jgi:hypothetical protein